MIQNNKTRKKRPKPTINGKVLAENNHGWKSLHIWGDAYSRGFAHGVLLHRELKRVQKSLVFLVKNQLKTEFSKYKKANKTTIVPIVAKNYTEIYEEIRGISAGAKYAGTNISVEILIAWNAYLSLYDIFVDNRTRPQQRCSAFIATGDATKNGDIVMAHNTHSDFLSGQLLNIVLKITPTSGGQEFVMQTAPGMVCSTSDWYISKSGIVCCETTIGGINYKPKFGSPYFCRIRETIQYANTLDQCIETMRKNNAGDYACSWLFGDIRTGEIMLFELGQKVANIQRTTSGVFYGANSAISLELRSRETDDADFNNPDTSSGNRNYRTNYLLNNQYFGKINVAVAKKIMGDHYDAKLAKNATNQRGICKHSELDAETGHKLYGATDAKVLDSRMAKSMNFWGIFGSGCGKRDFRVGDFVRQHPQYKPWGEVLEDIRPQNWTIL